MVVERSATLPPNGVGNGRPATTATYQPVQIKIAPQSQHHQHHQQQTQQSNQQSNNGSLLMKTGSATSVPVALEVSDSGDGQQHPCNCCPYGYHIDRDFVRFCESYRTPDGQIYQRTVKSRLVMPWDPPLSAEGEGAVQEDDEEDVEIEIDGEIAYMHVERVVTETLEDAPQLAEYYQWSPDVPVPVMQKFRTVHESRREEEGVVNLHHTEHATYEMKPPQAPAPPPVSVECKAIETDEVYLRNAGCQAEIVIAVPKHDASTGVCVDRREVGATATVPLSCSGFGNGDVRSYRDPPELRSVGCGDGAPRQRDATFGNNCVDKLPYIDPQLRCTGANYENDAPWIKTMACSSMMAGPSFFRGSAERGLQADLLPKPPKTSTVGTQFDKRWGMADSYAGDAGPRNMSCVGVQVQPDVSSRTTPNPWPDIRPITYEAATEASIDPDFIEKETCSVNFANSFETILRAIYQHQIINKEDVMAWLQEALYKEVKSSEVQVDTEYLEQLIANGAPNKSSASTSTSFECVGVQTTVTGSADNRANSGLFKNHATQVRPKTSDSGSWTDRAVTLCASTGTESIERCHKQTTTQPAITYTVGTSTEPSRDEGGEFRHMWSRQSKTDQRTTSTNTDPTPIKVETVTNTNNVVKPQIRSVEIPVQTSPSPPAEPPTPQPLRPLPPQLSPAVRPKKSDTVKVDINSRIRQFEQQISASAAPAVEPADSDHVPRRPVVNVARAGSEEDLPRSHRARPETRPVRPQLSVEVIGIKPAGRDIGFLESAVRYRSSSSSLPASSRPLKSCLKKSFSELVGPDPSGEGWGSSDEALSKQSPSHERKISFSDKVQETLVSPAVTDEEEGSSSDSERRRKCTSDSDDSFDEGTYRVQQSSSSKYQHRSASSTTRSSSSSSSGKNIRETYTLPSNVCSACERYARHLEGEEKLSEFELDGIVATIGGAWFASTSQKVSDHHQVEDYMSSFKNVSPVVLEKVATMHDPNGNTALHYAVSQANFQVVSLLLDVPAVELSVDVFNRAGYSAVMLASLVEPQTPEHRDILTRLFKAGNVNARSAHALQTALMLSSAHGRLAVVDLLLACGADPNAQDADGSTALMTAAEHGYVDVVRRLLADPRTDPLLVDVEGSTALSIALNSGSKDVALLLYGKLDFSKTPKTTSELKAEETSIPAPASSSTVVIPVVRTSAKATPHPHSHSHSHSSHSHTSSLPVVSSSPLSPGSRILPRAPMRSSGSSTTIASASPRFSRRTKTTVTSESSAC